MMKYVRAAVCCVAVVCACKAHGEVTWPSDFWEKVSASVVKPSASQIATGSAEIEVSSLLRESVYCDSLGTVQSPFDSRYFTCGIAVSEEEFDSRPLGLILTFR